MSDSWLDRFVSRCVVDNSFCVQFTPLAEVNGGVMIGYVVVDSLTIVDVTMPPSRHCCDTPRSVSIEVRNDAVANAKRTTAFKRSKLLVAVTLPEQVRLAVRCPLNGMRLRVCVSRSILMGNELADSVRCSAFEVDRSRRPLVVTAEEKRRYFWSPVASRSRTCIESLPILQNCAFELDCLQLVPFPTFPVDAHKRKRDRVTTSPHAPLPIVASQGARVNDYQSAQWRDAPLFEFTARDMLLLRLAPNVVDAAADVLPTVTAVSCVRLPRQISTWLATQGAGRRASGNWGRVKKRLRIRRDDFGDLLEPSIDRFLSMQNSTAQLIPSRCSLLNRASLLYASALDEQFWFVAYVVSFRAAYEVSRRDALDTVVRMLVQCGTPLTLLLASQLGEHRENIFRAALLGEQDSVISSADIDSVLRMTLSLAQDRDVFEWPRLPDAEVAELRSVVADAAQIACTLEQEKREYIDRRSVVVCDWLVRPQDVAFFAAGPLRAVPLRDYRSSSSEFQRVAFMLASDAELELKLRTLFDPIRGAFTQGGIDVVRVETRADHDAALCAAARNADATVVYCGDEYHRQLAEAVLPSGVRTFTDSDTPPVGIDAVLCIPFAHRYSQHAVVELLSACHGFGRLVVIGLPLTPYDSAPLREGSSLVDDLFFAASSASSLAEFAEWPRLGVPVPFLRAWSGKGDLLRRLDAEHGAFDTLMTFVARDDDPITELTGAAEIAALVLSKGEVAMANLSVDGPVVMGEPSRFDCDAVLVLDSCSMHRFIEPETKTGMAAQLREFALDFLTQAAVKDTLLASGEWDGDVRTLRFGCALNAILGLMFNRPRRVVWLGELPDSVAERPSSTHKTPYERAVQSDANWFDSYAACANSALPYTLGPAVENAVVSLLF